MPVLPSSADDSDSSLDITNDISIALSDETSNNVYSIPVSIASPAGQVVSRYPSRFHPNSTRLTSGPSISLTYPTQISVNSNAVHLPISASVDKPVVSSTVASATAPTVDMGFSLSLGDDSISFSESDEDVTTQSRLSAPQGPVGGKRDSLPTTFTNTAAMTDLSSDDDNPSFGRPLSLLSRGKSASSSSQLSADIVAASQPLRLLPTTTNNSSVGSNNSSGNSGTRRDRSTDDLNGMTTTTPATTGTAAGAGGAAGATSGLAAVSRRPSSRSRKPIGGGVVVAGAGRLVVPTAVPNTVSTATASVVSAVPVLNTGAGTSRKEDVVHDAKDVAYGHGGLDASYDADATYVFAGDTVYHGDTAYHTDAEERADAAYDADATYAEDAAYGAVGLSPLGKPRGRDSMTTASIGGADDTYVYDDDTVADNFDELSTSPHVFVDVVGGTPTKILGSSTATGTAAHMRRSLHADAALHSDRQLRGVSTPIRGDHTLHSDRSLVDSDSYSDASYVADASYCDSPSGSIGAGMSMGPGPGLGAGVGGSGVGVGKNSRFMKKSIPVVATADTVVHLAAVPVQNVDIREQIVDMSVQAPVMLAPHELVQSTTPMMVDSGYKYTDNCDKYANTVAEYVDNSDTEDGLSYSIICTMTPPLTARTVNLNTGHGNTNINTNGDGVSATGTAAASTIITTATALAAPSVTVNYGTYPADARVAATETVVTLATAAEAATSADMSTDARAGVGFGAMFGEEEDAEDAADSPHVFHYHDDDGMHDDNYGDNYDDVDESGYNKASPPTLATHPGLGLGASGSHIPEVSVSPTKVNIPSLSFPSTSTPSTSPSANPGKHSSVPSNFANVIIPKLPIESLVQEHMGRLNGPDVDLHWGEHLRDDNCDDYTGHDDNCDDYTTYDDNCDESSEEISISHSSTHNTLHTIASAVSVAHVATRAFPENDQEQESDSPLPESTQPLSSCTFSTSLPAPTVAASTLSLSHSQSRSHSHRFATPHGQAPAQPEVHSPSGMEGVDVENCPQIHRGADSDSDDAAEDISQDSNDSSVWSNGRNGYHTAVNAAGVDDRDDEDGGVNSGSDSDDAYAVSDQSMCSSHTRTDTPVHAHKRIGNSQSFRNLENPESGQNNALSRFSKSSFSQATFPDEGVSPPKQQRSLPSSPSHSSRPSSPVVAPALLVDVRRAAVRRGIRQGAVVHPWQLSPPMQAQNTHPGLGIVPGNFGVVPSPGNRVSHSPAMHPALRMLPLAVTASRLHLPIPASVPTDGDDTEKHGHAESGILHSELTHSGMQPSSSSPLVTPSLPCSSTLSPIVAARTHTLALIRERNVDMRIAKGASSRQRRALMEQVKHTAVLRSLRRDVETALRQAPQCPESPAREVVEEVQEGGEEQAPVEAGTEAPTREVKRGGVEGREAVREEVAVEMEMGDEDDDGDYAPLVVPLFMESDMHAMMHSHGVAPSDNNTNTTADILATNTPTAPATADAAVPVAAPALATTTAAHAAVLPVVAPATRTYASISTLQTGPACPVATQSLTIHPVVTQLADTHTPHTTVLAHASGSAHTATAAAGTTLADTANATASAHIRGPLHAPASAFASASSSAAPCTPLPLQSSNPSHSNTQGTTHTQGRVQAAVSRARAAVCALQHTLILAHMHADARMHAAEIVHTPPGPSQLTTTGRVGNSTSTGIDVNTSTKALFSPEFVSKIPESGFCVEYDGNFRVSRGVMSVRLPTYTPLSRG